LALLVVMMSVNLNIGVVIPAFAIAILMIVTRCISSAQARASVNWQTLIVIAAALGLAEALTKSGLVDTVTSGIVAMTNDMGPELRRYVLLALIYIVTVTITETITNNAAAALMFPFAVGMAVSMGLDPRPYVMAVTFAASASFITPLGYQTNLMVYGPGGYKFKDFVRAGFPLSALLLIVATFLIPLVWPF